MPNFNDKVADEYVAHAVDLTRVSEGIRGDVLKLLHGLRKELFGQLVDENLAEVLKLTDRQRRTENLIKEAGDTIATAYKDVNEHVSNELMELADVAHDSTLNIMDSVFSKEVSTTTLTRHTLEELVTNSMIQGAPCKDWWGKQSVDTQNRFASQLRMGMAAGENNTQLIRRIVGRKTGNKVPVTDAKGKTKMVPEFTGGVMDVSEAQATALVRTACTTVNNNVQNKTFEENQDILAGRQLLVTLDGRTSPICQARSGGAWDFQGNPLPSSAVKVPFPGPPPYHFNCRSILIPVTKSWNDLIEDAGGEKIPGLEDFDKGTQASMDGQVAADLTYEQWLKTKPEEFQKQVLGPTKFQLWKDGKLTLPEMIDQSGNPLTVAQLKAKAGFKMEEGKTVARRNRAITKKNEAKATATLEADTLQRQHEAEKQLLRQEHEQKLAQLETAKQNEVIAAQNAAKAEAQLKAAEAQRLHLAEKQQLRTEVEAQQEEVAKQKEALAQAEKVKAEALAAKKKADAERVKAYKAKKKAEKEAAKKAEELAKQEAAKAAAEEAARLAKEEADRIAKEKAEAEARVKQAPPPFPPDTKKLKVVKGLGGSTGAQLVEDEWGQRFVMKKGANPGHLREEYAAEQGYRALGVLVPDSKLYEDDGGPVKLSKFVEGGRVYSAVSKSEQAKMSEALEKHFVVDALMGNTDVVGEGYDNVMLGGDGNVYRIDVGGSLRYRAMGEAKTPERWNEYPTEAFTMRDPKVNKQTATVFGRVSPGDISQQVKEVLKQQDKFLEALPEEVRPMMKARLENAAWASRTIDTLTADKWKEDYVDLFGRHQQQLGAAGVYKRLPKQLTQEGTPGNVGVVDENGVRWDQLRGNDTIVKHVADYMAAQGGNYKVISDWSGQQGGSSWSDASKAWKYHIVRQRAVPDGAYFWGKNKTVAEGVKQAKDEYDAYVKNYGGEQKYHESVAMWHAYHTAFMEKVHLDGVDRAKGVIRLVRSEGPTMLAEQGLKVGQTKLLNRGSAESYATHNPVRFGGEMTIQEVPFHRTFGDYLHSRYQTGSGDFFLGDSENETVAMTEGLPVTYVGSYDNAAKRNEVAKWLTEPGQTGKTKAPLPRIAFATKTPGKATTAYGAPVTTAPTPATSGDWTTTKPKPLVGIVNKVKAGGTYTATLDISTPDKYKAVLDTIGGKAVPPTTGVPATPGPAKPVTYNFPSADAAWNTLGSDKYTELYKEWEKAPAGSGPFLNWLNNKPLNPPAPVAKFVSIQEAKNKIGDAKYAELLNKWKNDGSAGKFIDYLNAHASSPAPATPAAPPAKTYKTSTEIKDALGNYPYKKAHAEFKAAGSPGKFVDWYNAKQAGTATKAPAVVTFNTYDEMVEAIGGPDGENLNKLIDDFLADSNAKEGTTWEWVKNHPEVVQKYLVKPTAAPSVPFFKTLDDVKKQYKGEEFTKLNEEYINAPGAYNFTFVEWVNLKVAKTPVPPTPAVAIPPNLKTVEEWKKALGEYQNLDVNQAAFNKNTGQFEYGTVGHFETYKYLGGKLKTYDDFIAVYFDKIDKKGIDISKKAMELFMDDDATKEEIIAHFAKEGITLNPADVEALVEGTDPAPFKDVISVKLKPLK